MRPRHVSKRRAQKVPEMQEWRQVAQVGKLRGMAAQGEKRRGEGMSAALASFGLVYLRAIQQQNVIHGHYWLAAATSFAIAVAEVAVVLAVIHYTWSAVPWIGMGGAVGVTAAMATHRYIRKVLEVRHV